MLYKLAEHVKPNTSLFTLSWPRSEDDMFYTKYTRKDDMFYTKYTSEDDTCKYTSKYDTFYTKYTSKDDKLNSKYTVHMYC